MKVGGNAKKIRRLASENCGALDVVGELKVSIQGQESKEVSRREIGPVNRKSGEGSLLRNAEGRNTRWIP